MDYRSISSVQNILLTGATGVMGSRLLLEILCSTDAMVYCLSRDKDVAKALSRINDIVDAYDVDQRSAKERWRIVPIHGNVAAPELGLEPSIYEEMCDSMDLVFHCAANVSLIASYEKLKAVNVHGVEHIIDFCLSGDIPVVYASSYSVIGDNLFHDVTLHENQLDIGQGFEDLGYEKSKFDAELALRRASDKGLNWSIVRPGNIWGDSQSGAYPLNETKVKGIYYDIVKTLVETGYSYSSTEDFDITPVDYVCEATLYIGMHIHLTNRKTYHLTNRSPINFNQLVDAIRGYGYTIRDVDPEEYFTAIHEDRIIRNGEVYRSTFTDILSIFVDDDGLEEMGKWSTRDIQDLLDGTSIQYPEWGQDLMNRYLDFAVKVDWIPSVTNQSPLAEISEEMGSKVFMEHLYDRDLDEVS